ncbi:MAG: tetratricopeptide repeat protein [Bacteroidales bacterium]|nr:tetratricopeptide repeat protein [Bacteroidales bacterium]
MKYQLKSPRIYISIGILLLFAAACSTSKNTAINRSYHNVVSRYNILFNGKEAFKQGFSRMEKDYHEPFNDILPVFFFTQTDVLPVAGGDMDRAVSKAAKLIKEHSITARPKQKKAPSTDKEREFYYRREYNNWIDDAYLLMGKAQYMKQNYFEAQKSFMFLINEYRNEPVRYDATLWLAHTKIAMQQYDDAKDILDKVVEVKDFPEHLRSELYALYADIFICQGKYDEAINYMLLAIQFTTNKKTLVRYHYIVAQLYKETDVNEKAAEHFAQVLELHPNYEFAFNARISQATAFEGGRGASAATIAILRKLLKDKKNAEFKDQIYFALANVYMAENDEENALTYYKKSVESSTTNAQQKAMSLLAIGNIYYNQRQYLAAQPYYDSTMMVLPEEYRNYNDIKTKSNNLNILAKYHYMAHIEDSLQRIARMSEKERNNYIDNIIRKINEEERLKAEQEMLEMQNALMYGQQDLTNSMQSGQGGKWYFYNEAAVRLGKTEFKQRWGDRMLEDNWRRSSKSTSFSDMSDESENEDEENGDEQGEKAVPQITDVKNRQYYLQNLPLTDSALAVSTKRIEEGLFNQGMTYMNLIGDNKLAIASLEEYVKRFPKNTYTAISLYYLYKLYDQEQNFAKADSYKAQVIKQFPHSNYAKVLTNPDFQKDIKAQEKQVGKMYADAYRAYLRGDYKMVIRLAHDQVRKFPDTYLASQFQFLCAMSEGRMADIQALKASLENFVKQYPKEENTSLAQSILTYITNNDSAHIAAMMTAHLARTMPSDTTDTTAIAHNVPEEEKELFSLETNPPFLYVLAVKSEFVDINQVKFNAINYNLDYFTNFDFDVQIKELTSKTSLLVISPFESQGQAMNYFDLINYNQEIFEGIEKVFTNHFIISEQNYQILLVNKDVEAYMKFFDENYEQR